MPWDHDRLRGCHRDIILRSENRSVDATAGGVVDEWIEPIPLCANMSETSSPSTITVGRGRKSHIDKHEQDKHFFRRVGGFGA